MAKSKARPSTQTTGRISVRNERLMVVLICTALAAAAVVPFFFMGRSERTAEGLTLRMPMTHDMFLHYDQMRSFYNGLAAGEPFPRWEEDTNRGFGAPTTNYYPPAIYYLTSAMYVVTSDWLRALLDALMLMTIASAAAIYLYARQVMDRRPALVAMAAYVLLPYHVTDLYQRGALAELLSFVWMPLTLLFAERLMKQDSGKTRVPNKLAGVSLLALGYGAFLWSHPPTAYQFTLGLGLYVGIRAITTREWRGLIWVSAGLAGGLLVAGAYLFPAFAEQDLIHREYIAETWPYHGTYVFIHELYTSDLHRGFFQSIDGIWIFSAAAIAGSALLMKFKLPGSLVGDELRRRTVLWTALGAFTSFMMLKLSQPIGMLIPRLDTGVFTWRMLSITTLVMALLAGAFAQASIEASQKRLRSERLLFGWFAAVIAAGGMLFSLGIVVVTGLKQPVFVPEPEHLNYATLPRTAPADAGELPTETPRAQLAAGQGTIVIERWDPEHRVIRVEVADADRLIVRTFNFPGWTATVNGRPVEIITNEGLGEMAIALESGTHRVTLDFLDTPVRRTGKRITLSAFGVCIVLLVLSTAWRSIKRR